MARTDGRVAGTERAPTGWQVDLRLADQHAVVTEVGALLRSYQVDGRDVVVPFGVDEMAPASHGAVLLPWPNRIRDGQYGFDGTSYQLALSEPQRQVALHGLVCWERWSLLERSDAAVTLGIDLVPTPGYPFPLRARITYGLTGDGLGVELTTVNLGDRDAPYGVGFHPWLSPGEATLDECMLSVDARTWIPTDERLLPVGEAAPIPGRLDFRRPRALRAAVLDDAFVDATHSDGRSWARLTSPDGRTAAAWMDESLTCWQVCTGDALAAAEHVRTGLAAEPMTCVADAFRTGDRLIRLAPGQGHTVGWGLALR